MINAKKIILTLLAPLAFTACSSNVRFQAPANVAQEWCDTYGEFNGVKIYCSTDKIESSANFNRSLVFVIETGSAEANAKTSDSPFSGMLQGKDIGVIAPHMRMIMSNLAISFLEKLTEKNKQYDAIYFINKDSGLKGHFVNMFNSSIHHSKEVDLFLMTHGSAGKILMNQNLSSDPSVSLSSAEILDIANRLGIHRHKLKAIFNTSCFSAATPSSGLSIVEALKQGFPSAGVYGEAGINYFPLHRDFVAFEDFQISRNFEGSIKKGNQFVSTNSASGAPRNNVTYPSVKGEGCVNLFFTDKCQTQLYPLGSFPVYQSMINSSLAIVYNNSYYGAPVEPQPTLPPATPTPLEIGIVKGYIDRVENGKIEGWACVERYNSPISVHVYYNGLAGSATGQFIASSVANIDSEQAVFDACSTQKVTSRGLFGRTILNGHRFSIQLSSEQLQKIGSSKLFVHGLHPDPSGMKNIAIHRSGQLNFNQNSNTPSSATRNFASASSSAENSNSINNRAAAAIAAAEAKAKAAKEAAAVKAAEAKAKAEAAKVAAAAKAAEAKAKAEAARAAAAAKAAEAKAKAEAARAAAAAAAKAKRAR